MRLLIVATLLLAGCSAHQDAIGPDIHAYDPPDALAQETAPGAGPDAADTDAAGPVTAVEQCNIVYGTTRYAEHNFPGQTMQQLARVLTISHLVQQDGGAYVSPGGYADMANISPLLVKDGYVEMTCNSNIDSVTFILLQ